MMNYGKPVKSSPRNAKYKPTADKPMMEEEATTPAGMRRDMAKDKRMMNAMKKPRGR